MSENDLPAGFAVGAYRVERKLGQGGMGTVYVAVHHALEHKRAAVKVLVNALGMSTDAVVRFKTEAQAAALIRHPSIVDTYDWGQLPDGRHYLLMEYLQGESLAERLGRGTMPGREMLDVFGQVLEGLEAAHAAKIVHRDLKPENLFIVRPPHGEKIYVKILDFGIAKLLDADGGTRTGAVLGTATYMAPEQCRGQPLDHRADIYAIGVILYQTFAGRPPFRGDSLPGILAQHLVDEPVRPSTYAAIPAEMERLILDCLAKRPEDRPASAAEVWRRLRAGLVAASRTDAGGIGATLPAASTVTGGRTGPEPAGPAARRRKWLVAGLTAAMLALAVAGFASRAGRAPAPGVRDAEARAAAIPRVSTSTIDTTDPTATLPAPPAAAPAKAAASKAGATKEGRGARPAIIGSTGRSAPVVPEAAPGVLAPGPTRAQRRGLIETLEVDSKP